MNKPNAKNLKFAPQFFKATPETPEVWDTVQYEKRESKITSSTGEVIFEMKQVEVPSFWSQLATDIVASKYFRKAGVPGVEGRETSVRQLIHRVCRTIADRGREEGYFDSDDDALTFENDLKWLCLHQYGAFNSPVWFNVGLYHEYGISGSGENFAWKEGDQYEAIQNQYARPQGSACFIQSVDDTLSSIFDLVKNEARLFKYGSGTGSNMSRLRGVNERLSGGGQSSGLLSFLKVLDAAAGAIKSGGTTRRAAVMRCLDIDHPEVEDFIEWKVKEEEKVRALVAQGYDPDFNGEAYATVSGQNSNNSVRLSDEFLAAVEADGDWQTLNRVNHEPYKTYKARDLFQKICEATWACADPGVQYDTTINDWHTCSASAPIRASNPCSEFMFVDDTACNLASLNLVKFYQKGEFQIEDYRKACRLFLTAQEILVDLASYPTEKITRNSHEFRPLGLGYANLGTLLMMMGYPYDSEEGRALAGMVTAIMTGSAYEMSAELAEAKGPFVQYEKNKEPMLRVMQKHREAIEREDFALEERAPALAPLKEKAREIWDAALLKGKRQGYRNAQTTVLAPTGTIGLLMDCSTTGVEPAFSLVMWKKLSGGGVIPMVNQSVPAVLNKLGYSLEEVKAISAFVTEKQTIEGAPGLKAEHLAIFDCAIPSGHGERLIDPMGHVKMMAVTQPFLSGAISKTINMPQEATVPDIHKVYMESWKLGLKAVAIYRDGSKGSQPLNAKQDEEATLDERATIEALRKENARLERALEERGAGTVEIRAWGSSRKLPDVRIGRTWEFKVAGTKIFLRSGENEDGSLGEIFVDLGYKEGGTVRALMNQFAISVSFSLQHGVPLEKLVDRFTFTKFEPHGMVSGHPFLKSATSLIDAIFRVLGHHYLGRTDFLQVQPSDKPEPLRPHTPKFTMPQPVNAPKFEPDKAERTSDHHPCGECGGSDFLRTGTCYVCITCGASQGCS